MHHRSGEAPKTWFRTDRFYTVGSDWFVATREGNDIGPFRSRNDAARSVGLYVKGVNQQKNTGVHARSLSTDVWATSNFL